MRNITGTNELRVAFFPAASDACALYRLFIPHINTPDSKYIFEFGRLNYSHFSDCQVAVVQRQVLDNNLKALQDMRQMGMKIVYDLDDDIWSLPAYNPGKQAFDALTDSFTKCAAEADIITVSTRGLSTAAKTGFRLDKEIIVVPNAMDVNLFYKKEIHKYDDRVIVGWGGSNTHSEDVSDAFDAVIDVLNMNKNTYMEIVGAPATETVTEAKIDIHGRHLQRKVTRSSKIGKHPRSLPFRKWVPVGEYPNRISCWGWDIALAPLLDNRFNRSKSNIKILEAAAIGIPCLVSDVQPYSEFCALGGDDLKWLLCRTQSDWKNKLHVLVNEPERREALAKRMYDVMFKFFNISNIKNNWNYAFQKAIQ